MAIRVEPLGDKVVVRPSKPQEKSEGGLFLPTTSQEKKSEGTIVEVGRGKVDSHGVLHEPQVSKGDHVVYSKYAGTEINVDGEDLLVIESDDCLVIVHSE